MNKNILIIITIIVIGFLIFGKRLFTFNSTDEKVEVFQQKKNIDALTDEKKVIEYVKKNKKLPEYYITKAQARQQGWQPSKGNLCEVLPGKAIGGDKFFNREKKLPQNQPYYEADVNYNCGKRTADRIIFTKNGDVWLTKNHYQSFIKQ